MKSHGREDAKLLGAEGRGSPFEVLQIFCADSGGELPRHGQKAKRFPCA